MTRANKLGITSVVLFVAALVLHFGPVTAAAIWIGLILGFFAGKQGSRWWFLPSGLILALGTVVAYFGFHAR
jgi:hypothetical protein